MVGHKGGRHRNPLVLAKGIELHGADKVQADLADTVGSRGGQCAKEDDEKDFNQNKKRVPTKHLHLSDPFCKHLGEDGSGKVSKDRNQNIEGPCEIPLPERHAEQNDVCRLRIAKHAAPYTEGIGSVVSSDHNQGKKYPVFFTFQKKFPFFLYRLLHLPSP